MKVLQCNSCGVTLSPDASFCRQCGTRVTGEVASREQPLPTFREPSDNLTTQQLYPRETGDRSDMELRPPSRPVPIEAPAASRATHPIIFGAIALIVLLISIVAVVAVVKTRTPTKVAKGAAPQSTAESDLVYPGATTIVDITGADGTRILQLRTDDPLDSVHMWYDMNLHPTKTLRLSDFSVVLKNEKITATMLSENKQTSILIKQVR